MKLFYKIYLANFVLFLIYSSISYIYPLAFLPKIGWFFTYHALLMFISFPVILVLIIIAVIKNIEKKKKKKQ